MMLGETLWDLDQMLKSIIHEDTMTLTDEQHYTWFIASLTPYMKIALLQRKISTQAEELEEPMWLHETLIPNPGLGVQQIQAHLQNLCLEMWK